MKDYGTEISPWITVEPIMFFYMFAFMFTAVPEQAFFTNKACRANHGHSIEVCLNLNNESNSEIKKEVQVTVSTFHQWNGIAGHVVPIILALFLGAWSDKRGRKGVMIIGLFGKLFYSIAVAIIASQETWPLEYVIYFATLPSAITGTDVAIFASAFAYISDVSTPDKRTMRVGILDVCYLSTMPTGIPLGTYIYEKVGKSISIMFGINASLLTIAIIYGFIRLKWKTTNKHQTMKEAGAKNFFSDFFDSNHVTNSLKTLLKRRPGKRRIYLLIMMISMMLYTFQRDEKPMLYLYTTNIFNWDEITYSNFKTYQSTAFVIVMLLGIPFMSHLLKWRDSVIIMIGALSHALGRIVFALAKEPWLFYVGATVSSLGPCVAPVLRSMTSKTVPASERGRVFALLSVCDNAVTLFSATLYSQLYNATIKTDFPNAIFFLTIASQSVVLILTSYIHLSLGAEPMEKYSIEFTDDTSIKSSNLK